MAKKQIIPLGNEELLSLLQSGGSLTFRRKGRAHRCIQTGDVTKNSKKYRIAKSNEILGRARNNYSSSRILNNSKTAYRDRVDDVRCPHCGEWNFKVALGMRSCTRCKEMFNVKCYF